jgi:hypothetical protein
MRAPVVAFHALHSLALGWHNLGGNFTGTPKVVCWRGDDVSVLAVSADPPGRLMYNWSAGGSWSGWTDVTVRPFCCQTRIPPVSAG